VEVQTTPNPAGVLGSQLTGVSCPSAKACFAVGASSTSDQGNQPLAEHWNGSAWSVQRIPTPSSVLAGNPFKLLAVSCAAAHSCVTVGFYFDPSLDGNVIVAEHWNGKRWAIQNIVTPPGSTSTLMQGVSCSAAASCTAVGSYTNASGLGVTLAEVWNGTSWAIQDTPSPAGATEGSALIGVPCPSAADCTAALGNRLLHQQQCASEAARGALERHLLGGRGCPRSLWSAWQLAAGRGLVLIAQQVHRRRLVAEQVRDQLHACRTQVDRARGSVTKSVTIVIAQQG
jgi:hypothetical protein